MTEEKKPLISVLMGVYNCKERSMLERSVRSIVEQTYPNWELILCDDGSTNAALLWMQNLAARDSRIRLLQNDRNLGLAHLWRRGHILHGRMMMTFPNLTALKSRLPIWNRMQMWISLALIVICIRRMAVFPAAGNDRNALESRIFCLIRRLYMVRFYFGDGVLKKSAAIQ